MTEKLIHAQICDYLHWQYPKVLFNTDLSGIRLTIGQASQLKRLRSGSGFPDIIILKPNKNFHGLFLEVKKESPFKKDGKLKKNKHLEAQNKMHIKLNNEGYYAAFVWTFSQAKELIDNYLNH